MLNEPIKNQRYLLLSTHSSHYKSWNLLLLFSTSWSGSSVKCKISRKELRSLYVQQCTWWIIFIDHRRHVFPRSLVTSLYTCDFYCLFVSKHTTGSSPQSLDKVGHYTSLLWSLCVALNLYITELANTG